MFKQSKKYIADFIIEFKSLAIKTDIDKLYPIFLLKKNIQTDIIKMILGYLLRSTPPGVNMGMGKGYDDNDRLRRSNLSQHLMWQA